MTLIKKYEKQNMCRWDFLFVIDFLRIVVEIPQKNLGIWSNSWGIFYAHFLARWVFVYIYQLFQFAQHVLRIMSQLRRFLLCFAQENVEFRRPEIESIIKIFKLDVKLPCVSKKPYWILENVSESDLKKIASRSLSLRYIVEIWSSATTYETFHDNLKAYSCNIDQLLKESSFRITIDTYNKKTKHAEKIQRIESMDYLPLEGTINLTNPDNNFIYFEFWGLDPMNVPPEPEEIVFGRFVCQKFWEMHLITWSSL